jgi:lantibiotic modifying enzyme
VEASRPAEVSAELSSRLLAHLETLVAQCDSAYRHAPSTDTCIYTGTAGIALLHLHLATTLYADNQLKSRSHLQQAHSLLAPSLSHLPSRDVTFLCGAGGPLAIAAVLEAALGRPDQAKRLVQRLEQLYTGDKSRFSRLPSELLYGHVGYLYCLLFTNAYLPGAISSELLQEVVSVVVEAGERGREADTPSPLMYTWHGKHYLGAAHGLAGIATVLLQVTSDTPPDPLTPTVKYLTDLQFPSGNFPSSLESYHGSSHHSDMLVHWCHGAPGFIHLLSHAYQVLGDGQYLSAAEQCGGVVWKRGLLRKGYGLCHGAAGNAYTFLQLYRLTGHAHHWHRALKVTAYLYYMLPLVSHYLHHTPTSGRV